MVSPYEFSSRDRHTISQMLGVEIVAETEECNHDSCVLLRANVVINGVVDAIGVHIHGTGETTEELIAAAAQAVTATIVDRRDQ